MRIRIVRLQTRNPVVGAALLVLLLALVAAVLAVGLTLLAALAVAGGAVLLGRRVLHGRRIAPPAPARPDRAGEVFPTRAPTIDGVDATLAPTPAPPARRLPPARDAAPE